MYIVDIIYLNREIYVVEYVVMYVVGFMKLLSWSICRGICRHRFDENFHVMIQFDVWHREVYVVEYVVVINREISS